MWCWSIWRISEINKNKKKSMPISKEYYSKLNFEFPNCKFLVYANKKYIECDAIDFEYENGFEWDENDNANCNYKIGFLDPEGNLIESYDTGCAMRGSPFGICPIDMRYSEKELKFFVTGGKGGTNLEAVFDMETKEFKVIHE